MESHRDPEPTRTAEHMYHAPLRRANEGALGKQSLALGTGPSTALYSVIDSASLSSLTKGKASCILSRGRSPIRR